MYGVVGVAARPVVVTTTFAIGPPLSAVGVVPVSTMCSTVNGWNCHSGTGTIGMPNGPGVAWFVPTAAASPIGVERVETFSAYSCAKSGLMNQRSCDLFRRNLVGSARMALLNTDRPMFWPAAFTTLAPSARSDQ